MEAATPAVVVVRWPLDATRAEQARDEGRPRLLLVDADAGPPVTVDPLEDWVRLPALDSDVQARLDALEARARRQKRPAVDDHGIVRFEGRWVALSPVEGRLVAVLSDRFGMVAGRDAVTKRVWPVDPPSRNALDVHMLRLRRRLAPLGLEVRTVRSRGYLLEVAP